MTQPASSPEFPVRWSLTMGILTLVILIGGFGSWAVFSRISGAIIASGQIVVDQNRQVVQHPDGGVVKAIRVDEGDTVAKGDVLLELDSDLLNSELAILEGQLFELIARRGRLEAERDRSQTIEFDPILTTRAAQDADVADLMKGQERLFEARQDSTKSAVEQLRKRIGQIRSQINGIVAQQEANALQETLIAEELAVQQGLLEKGLSQANRVTNLQRQQAQLFGEQGALTAQKAQAEGRITELDLEVLNIGTQLREEAISRLRDQQFQELELAERRRAILQNLSRMDITAPVSGIVYNLSVFTPRSVIRPADPVLFLVPQDRPLVIAARVDPIHIDQLHLDQEVILRFSALDQRKTPELMGRVVQISADAFTDEGTRASYYRAEIVLSEGELARLPEGATLIPGMPVEAFIRTEDRSPLAYLVKPVADYFARAFRES